MGLVALAMFVFVAAQDWDRSELPLVDILGLLAFASPAIVGAYLGVAIAGQPGWPDPGGLRVDVHPRE